MASQQRVQEYLQRHKIGPLFEDLMAKLINDMPDDPIGYLNRVLERKGNRQAMRRSTGDLAHSRARSPDPTMRKSMTATASGWGDPDALAVAKDRHYDKPWMTNTRRTKKTVGVTDPKTGQKSTKRDWDHHTKPEGTTFDDLWGTADGTHKGQKSRSRRSPSPTRPSKTTWADGYMDDEDLLFHSYGYRGPHKGRIESDDPLAGEFSIAKSSSKGSSKKTSSSTTSYAKKKDQKSSSARHKKELEKYLLQQQKQDSGFEDERDLDPDDAIELMENLDDLRREGVTNVKQRGVKVSSTYRQSPSQSAVSVSICARCARVMGGGVPSEPAIGGRYGDLPNYDYETEKELTHRTQPQSARFTALASDDEFESVSQVTGPRKPVWQDDSDGEALTPRKGTHMFTSHAVPSKGRPMYSSPDIPPGTDPRSKRGAPSGSRSQDFYAPPPTGRTSPPSGNYNKTWSPGAYSDKQGQGPSKAQQSPTEGAASDVIAPTERGDDDQFGSKGWQVPADYDTDSSYYGAGQHTKHSSKTRKSKTYSGY